jgi:hypothetical protein
MPCFNYIVAITFYIYDSPLCFMNAVLNVSSKRETQLNSLDRTVISLKGNKNGISVEYDHVFMMGIINDGLVPTIWSKLHSSGDDGSFYWRCLPSLSNIGAVLHKLQIGIPETAAGDIDNNNTSKSDKLHIFASLFANYIESTPVYCGFTIGTTMAPNMSAGMAQAIANNDMDELDDKLCSIQLSSLRLDGLSPSIAGKASDIPPNFF